MMDRAKQEFSSLDPFLLQQQIQQQSFPGKSSALQQASVQNQMLVNPQMLFASGQQAQWNMRTRKEHDNLSQQVNFFPFPQQHGTAPGASGSMGNHFMFPQGGFPGMMTPQAATGVNGISSHRPNSLAQAHAAAHQAQLQLIAQNQAGMPMFVLPGAANFQTPSLSSVPLDFQQQMISGMSTNMNPASLMLTQTSSGQISPKRKRGDYSDIVPGTLPKRRKRPKTKDSTSKYRGVSWHTRDQRWVARIWIKGRIRHLGSFRCEHQAGLAVDKKLLDVYGPEEELTLNFPDDEDRIRVENGLPPLRASVSKIDSEDVSETEDDKSSTKGRITAEEIKNSLKKSNDRLDLKSEIPDTQTNEKGDSSTEKPISKVVVKETSSK